jgi:lysophospholipase L1-like esterase
MTKRHSLHVLLLLVGACLGIACSFDDSSRDDASMQGPDPMATGTAGVNQLAAGTGGAFAGSGPAAGGASAGASSMGGAMAVAGGGAASGGDALGGGGATAGGTGIGGAGGVGGGALEPAVAACAMNQTARCTGTSPIKCDFAGGVGDYLVTVEIGGDAAGSTEVEAESNRQMLGTVATAAGEKKRFSFVANVRDPEGQPVQDVPRGTPGLQVSVRGSAPQLSSICATPVTAMPKLWVAGDSTVCDQSDTQYAGWAQHLPQYFRAPISVANYADSGESSSSVLNSAAMWGAIKAGWKAGDWVLVQVGHNDKTVSTATFQANINSYVTQAKAAQVNIVLCTPISRQGGSLASQHQSSGGADIPQIIRDVGKSENVPVIDLTTLTWNWLQEVGSDWPKYFALGTDRTHPNPAGAEIVAGFTRDAISEQKLKLGDYLR